MTPQFQFADTIRDFACSHTIRFIQRALIRLMAAPHLKMELQLMLDLTPVLGNHTLLLLCSQGSNSFEKHDQDNHLVD
jgi:hypothetical protein